METETAAALAAVCKMQCLPQLCQAQGRLDEHHEPYATARPGLLHPLASAKVRCRGPQVAIGAAGVALVVAVAFGLKKAADNGDLDHLDQTAKRKVLPARLLVRRLAQRVCRAATPLKTC